STSIASSIASRERLWGGDISGPTTPVTVHGRSPVSPTTSTARHPRRVERSAQMTILRSNEVVGSIYVTVGFHTPQYNGSTEPHRPILPGIQLRSYDLHLRV